MNVLQRKNILALTSMFLVLQGCCCVLPIVAQGLGNRSPFASTQGAATKADNPIAALNDIRRQLRSYYLENGTYPVSLPTAGALNMIEGRPVGYFPDTKDTYRLEYIAADGTRTVLTQADPLTELQDK